MITLHLDDAVIKSLSSNELNILKFVYERGEEVLDMSIQQFASEVSYSSATILRFCRKLGYSGFAEFKYAVRSQIKHRDSVPFSQKEPEFSIRALTAQTDPYLLLYHTPSNPQSAEPQIIPNKQNQRNPPGQWITVHNRIHIRLQRKNKQDPHHTKHTDARQADPHRNPAISNAA